MRDLDKLMVAKGFKKWPKVQLFAQSGHTASDKHFLSSFGTLRSNKAHWLAIPSSVTRLGDLLDFWPLLKPLATINWFYLKPATCIDNICSMLLFVASTPSRPCHWWSGCLTSRVPEMQQPAEQQFTNKFILLVRTKNVFPSLSNKTNLFLDFPSPFTISKKSFFQGEDALTLCFT